MMTTRLGTAPRIMRTCKTLACNTVATATVTKTDGALAAATSRSLLRKDKDVVEATEGDRRLDECRLREGAGLHRLDADDRPDRNPGVERAALAGHDAITDLQVCVLRDVLELDAGHRPVGDPPPAAALHDRREFARDVGDQQDLARQRIDLDDAP